MSENADRKIWTDWFARTRDLPDGTPRFSLVGADRYLRCDPGVDADDDEIYCEEDFDDDFGWEDDGVDGQVDSAESRRGGLPPGWVEVDDSHLRRIVAICEAAGFPFVEDYIDNPASDFESHAQNYAFLDGGLNILEELSDEAGAYVHGFKALRWLLNELGLPQPPLFEGEVM